MQHSPPPLFKQGAPARVKAVFFALIALALLIADARMSSTGTARPLDMARQVAGTVLYPFQKAALAPRDALYGVGSYFTSLSALQTEIKELKREQVANAMTLQEAAQLSADNAHLRKLLDSREKLPLKSLMGEILYDTRDAFTRKIVLDRGARDGVRAGQPVIDDLGVVGQVTRVFPFLSEVTLLTDKDQAIPVQVVRSGLRSVAYGRGHSGGLDLRFMAANADIKVGDLLVTSGIDGIYPSGLAVAKVTQVENNAAGAFGRIVCQPVAGVDRNKQLLIVLSEVNTTPRPEPEQAEKKGKSAKRLLKESKAKAEEAKSKEAAEKEEPAKDAAKPNAADAPKAPAAPEAKPAPASVPAAAAKPAGNKP